MDSSFVLLVGFIVILLFMDCSSADSKVNEGANNGLGSVIPVPLNKKDGLEDEKKDGSNLVSNPTVVDKVKGDQVGGSKEDLGAKTEIDKSSSISQSELGEVGSVQKGEGSSRKELKGKGSGDEKQKLGDGAESKDVGNEGDGDSSKTERNEGRGEECDSSNMCKVEKKFVACLRVPGDESPDLLLLIQNKGENSLSVTISAPDSVRLAEKEVQIQEKEVKEHIKVTVLNVDGGTDSLITLTAGNDKCSLDFRDLIAHSSQKEFDNTPKSLFISSLTKRPAVALIFLGPLLILVSAWICISFRRRRLSGSGSKYEKLDMELPVSSVAKSELDTNDGWDENWGDSWDDEEAPKTPSMPVTPNLSSKGLASRRLNKDGWKD
ncbi:uncharacterized protein LOC115975303 isoform X1 [Quercus lobata]|uniref:uncharacterized protein LOC115975303 isoform X1 n=1 Tax=Quercus lobata TaxID=97700 RepID=UPI0012441F7A|nr:uncharacterized protein LOC115975303 isoform X1 [Quercus lobata]